LASESAVIEIADTGAGIKPEHLHRIFDPGFTTKGVGVGLGLGLAIAYRIVEKHRGSILVHSILHQGSTFEIRLPINIV
jgi:two-component system C4-dicarboxylate transport sensor histidine kinase DctB